MSLGDGNREILYIVAAHGLSASDVLLINGNFILIKEEGKWDYLENSSYDVDGETWTSEVSQRLQKLIPAAVRSLR